MQPTDNPAPAPGRRLSRKPALRYFGDYVLLGEIARGGMGVVYRALQANLDREVAIKMIDAGALASDDAVRRFHTEAEAMAKLDHPNIVSIHEIGEHEGHHYFAMKLVDGPSLAEHAGDKPMDPRAAVELVAQVARAVQYAHGRGVLHRDLKPGNILLDERGQPHVTDFGIAKLVQREAGFTGTLATMGTPEYMAPEQAVGKTRHVGTAADIYSLGAVLYYLLTGEPPFKGETPFEVMDHVINDAPVSPAERNPAVDENLEAICLHCLEKKPERRYKTAEALAQDLETWAVGRAIGTRPTFLAKRRLSRANRRGVIAALSLVAVAAIGLMLAAVNDWHGKRQAQRTTQPGVAIPSMVEPFRITNIIYVKTGAAGIVREREEQIAEGDQIQYFNFTGRLQRKVVLGTDGTRQTNLYDSLGRMRRQETASTNGRKEIVSFTYDRNGRERTRETLSQDEKGRALSQSVVAYSIGLMTNQMVTNYFEHGPLGWLYRPAETGNRVAAWFDPDWFDPAGAPVARPFRYQWGWLGQEWYGQFKNSFAPDDVYPGLSHWLTDWLIAGYLADKHATGLSAAQLQAEAGATREEAETAKRIVALNKDVREVREAKTVQNQAEARAASFQQRAKAEAESLKARALQTNAAPISREIKAQIRRQIEGIVASRKSDAERAARGQKIPPPDLSKALADPAHIFIVSKTISVSLATNSSPAGTLNEGSMVRLDAAAKDLLNKPNEYTIVPASIVASTPGDVAPGISVMIPIRELQEFDSEFRARLDLGLAQAVMNKVLFKSGVIPQ